MIRWSRERGIHNHQISGFAGEDHVLTTFGLNVRALALRYENARAKKRRGGVVLNQVECAQGDGVLLFRALLSVRQGVDAGVAKGRARMHARQHGRGQVRGCRHDVGRDEGAFHHLPMQFLIVVAGSSMARGQSAVRRREQRARAASEVRHLQIDEGVRVGPIRVEPRYGQFPEQGRRSRQGVEGGEEFAVGDESLEHAPGKIVQRGRPQTGQVARRLSKAIENRIRRAVGERQEQIGGDAKYRVVVDVVEDVLPTV